MHVLMQRQFIEPKRLLLVHNSDVNTMQVYFLLCVKQKINGKFPFGIGKEIIIQHFYVLAVRIELQRLYRVD